MVNILLCGGSGSRLWPLSRTQLPKQFMHLFNDRSLFQETLSRNQPLCAKQLIVCHQDHYFLALEQAHFANSELEFLIEPCSRNTAAAITLACLTLEPEDIALITPADHVIGDNQAYKSAVNNAKQQALLGDIVLFGIQPNHAETGYGYIECYKQESKSLISEVACFHEKPNIETAQKYLANNLHGRSQFLWNSGMICAQAKVLLEAIKTHSPEIFRACQNAIETNNTESPKSILLADMQVIPDNSIDYAVLEKAKHLKVVNGGFYWSDLGSFDALSDELAKQENLSNEHKRALKAPAVNSTNNTNNNTCIKLTENSCQPFLENSQNNFIISHERAIALVDIDGLHIIDTPDALLIMPKGHSQNIKALIPKINNKNPNLLTSPNKVEKPYGHYEVLQSSQGYKVKRIYVKPGGRLSLQKHQFRSEHWVVVSGIATVTLDQQVIKLHANESTYIKMGQLHRLENQTTEDLTMIEIQVGSYTGEDDIERFDDHYGRQL